MVNRLHAVALVEVGHRHLCVRRRRPLTERGASAALVEPDERLRSGVAAGRPGGSAKSRGRHFWRRVGRCDEVYDFSEVVVPMGGREDDLAAATRGGLRERADQAPGSRRVVVELARWSVAGCDENTSDDSSVVARATHTALPTLAAEGALRSERVDAPTRCGGAELFMEDSTDPARVIERAAAPEAPRTFESAVNWSRPTRGAVKVIQP